jgi:hypothetical protein
MKKPINTKLHGILDYVFGFILLLPWITHFHEAGKDTLILSLLGATTIFMSLMTNYELSFIKIIPMSLHLVVDVISGLFLIALPFIFPLSNYYYYWPVILGVGELLIVILSSSKPFIVTNKDINIMKN